MEQLDQASTDFQFAKLKEKVTEELGFQTQHYSDRHLRRRFKIRMRNVGARTPQRYMKYLDENPPERQKLLDVLTVNVTEWFRNPAVYKKIKSKTLPDIISKSFDYGAELRFKKYKDRMVPSIEETAKIQKRKHLRFWSVGCSDGKEPYSLAMCVKDALGEATNLRVNIFAWDIDDAMLKKAREALYKWDDLKGLEPEHLEKYFIKEKEGYRVSPEIRAMVFFEKKDLHKDVKRKWIDLIMCRNVVIYLTKERKADLYLEFYNSLRPGGYYIMGMSETLLGTARTLFKSTDNTLKIYQK
ncbi:protein-glutamate O-methyltransferase CheR [archaeon]|nr:protein-glutamate O-methyltransferase CheR [archaeon]